MAAFEELPVLDGVSSTDLLQAFLPSEALLTDKFRDIGQAPTPSVLSVKNHLVSPASVETGAFRNAFQSEDFDVYIRVVLAYTLIITNSRSMAASYASIVPHLLVVSQVLTESVFLGIAASTSPSDRSALASILDRSAAYIVAQASKRLPSDWHETCIANLRKGTQSSDPVATVLQELVERSKTSPGGVFPRILAQVLKLVVRYTDMETAQAERWLSLAQSWQTPSRFTLLC